MGQNNPWSSITKDHSFTAYCAYNKRFNSIRTCIQFIPYVYMFVRMRAIIPCNVFGTRLSVHLPLYPDRGLTLNLNSVLHVQPQISTKHPLPFIMGLMRSPQFCFTTLIQDFILNLSITHSSFGTH